MIFTVKLQFIFSSCGP